MCVSLTKGHSGDGCDLASTFCTYYLRNGDLFVLNWARVQRMKQISISSELMFGGSVCSILLLPLVPRCLETNMCVYGTFLFDVCCSDCGNVSCVAAVVKDSVFSHGVLKYV